MWRKIHKSEVVEQAPLANKIRLTKLNAGEKKLKGQSFDQKQNDDPPKKHQKETMNYPMMLWDILYINSVLH